MTICGKPRSSDGLGGETSIFLLLKHFCRELLRLVKVEAAVLR